VDLIQSSPFYVRGLDDLQSHEVHANFPDNMFVLKVKWARKDSHTDRHAHGDYDDLISPLSFLNETKRAKNKFEHNRMNRSYTLSFTTCLEK
jgi:hypothetical protein